MAITITENKPVGLAIRGYHPFSPDAGILCGGYQGPMYPQPTSFYLPDGSVDLNVVEYQEPVADLYRMATTEDYYVGLGKANPSINYRNPGHIIGLMDTIGRMAYGLSIIASSQNGVYEGGIEPATTLTIPLIKFIENEGDELGDESEIALTDLYPEWSEIPSDYMDGILEDDGSFVIRPYQGQPFEYDTDKAYQPSADNDVTMEQFVNVATWESFLGMHDIFRASFSELAEFCNNTFGGESIHVLEQDGLCAEGTEYNSVPTPLIYSHDEVDYWPVPTETFEESTPSGTAYNDVGAGGFTSPFFKQLCAPLATGEALQLAYGSNQTHDGPTVQHEYRTFHEMNAVVNLLPVQMYGISFSRFQGYKEIHEGDIFTEHQWHGAWIVCDVVFMTNLATTFTINGTASFDFSYLNPTPEYFTIARDIRVSTSVTNKFIWNRAWFDVLETDEVELQAEEGMWQSTGNWSNHMPFDAGQGGTEPFSNHKPSFEEGIKEFPFYTSVDTDGTGQTVRMRIIVQSQMLRIEGNFDHQDTVKLDISLTGGGNSGLEINKTLELIGRNGGEGA